MNHSFLCIVGCDVYPRFGLMMFANPWDADFDRFVRRPEMDVFGEFTYSEMTG